jgi:hypothetical protein
VSSEEDDGSEIIFPFKSLQISFLASSKHYQVIVMPCTGGGDTELSNSLSVRVPLITIGFLKFTYLLPPIISTSKSVRIYFRSQFCIFFID